MNKIKLILSVVFLGLSSLLLAQSMNEAGEAFNEGIAAIKAKDYASAIKAYDKCVTICNQLGDEGKELKTKAESQIPDAYFSMGLGMYQGAKYDDAVNNLQKAAELAGKLNDKNLVDKSKNYIARVYTTKGSAQYKANDYENALVSFDKSIEADPTYTKAYLTKGMVYYKQEKFDEFKAAMDKVIEIGPADDNTVKTAQSTAFKIFKAEAGKDLQAANYKKSIENIETALKYEDGDSQIFYFATIAYNGTSNWQKAIEFGNKAVNLEQKSKSKIYFELGKAYEGIGNKSEACNAYKKVTDGPNVAAAQYKVNTELKCNG